MIRALNITLITLLSLALIMLLFFTVMFFLQRSYIKKEQKVKEEYNEIAIFSISGGLNYLEALSKNNKQLEGIVSSIIEAKKFYKIQSDNLKSKIIKLTIFNRNFQFRSSKVILKQIKKDLVNCHKLNHSIYSLYNSTTDYTDTTNALLTKFRVQYYRINDFYANHLLNRFNKEILAKLSNEISSLLTDCNNYIIKIDNHKVIESINQINEKCINYYRLIKTLYVYLQSFFYLSRSKQTLDKLFNENSRLLFEKERRDVEKIIVSTKINLEDLNDRLNDLDFDHCFDLIQIISQQVEPAVNIFQQNDRINLLIQNSLQHINESFELWSNNYASLLTNFAKIRDYFNGYNSNEIEKKLKEIEFSYKKLSMHLEILNHGLEKSNYTDRINFLKEILEFYNQVTKWQEEMTKLWDDITKKYQSSIVLINDLFDLQWTLSQILNYKKTINPHDKDAIANISENMETANKLVDLIHKNYAYNYDYVCKSIETLKEAIVSYYNDTYFDNIMCYYLKSLIFTANKYRYEDKMIEEAITKAEVLYQEKKYRDGIDVLYAVLEHIKDSAKINHIKFN